MAGDDAEPSFVQRFQAFYDSCSGDEQQFLLEVVDRAGTAVPSGDAEVEGFTMLGPMLPLATIGSASGGDSGSSLMQATQGMQEMQMSFNMQYLQLQSQMQNENRTRVNQLG